MTSAARGDGTFEMSASTPEAARPGAARDRLDLLPRRLHGPGGRPPGSGGRRGGPSSPHHDASDRARTSMAALGRHISFFCKFKTDTCNVSANRGREKGEGCRGYPLGDGVTTV